MNKKELPSKEYLLSLFEYRDGKLFWKQKTSKYSNIRVGYEVGYLDKNGYIIVVINSKHYKLHRIIWKMFYDTDPMEQLDHIDHDKSNNKIENLREVSQKENSKNQTKNKDNTSGYSNIYIRKDNVKKKYKVQFVSEKHTKCFLTLEEAINHRDEKYTEFGFHENHGG